MVDFNKKLRKQRQQQDTPPDDESPFDIRVMFDTDPDRDIRLSVPTHVAIAVDARGEYWKFWRWMSDRQTITQQDTENRQLAAYAKTVNFQARLIVIDKVVEKQRLDELGDVSLIDALRDVVISTPRVKTIEPMIQRLDNIVGFAQNSSTSDGTITTRRWNAAKSLLDALRQYVVAREQIVRPDDQLPKPSTLLPTDDEIPF